MEILFLQKDGRCLWLENKVLKGFMPMAIKNAANPFAKKLYVIIDWISNDYGKVGVDLKWLKSMGVPVAKTIHDLPKHDNIKVVNTGYDAIVNEEIILRDRGVEIIDKPCPFVRRVRTLLEENDPAFQYVLLCEPNHIIIKNFSSVFPDDLILVQMDNYKEEITKKANGKPIKLLPYVTFLESDAEEIQTFIQQAIPNPRHETVRTACMWVTSKASPIMEIDQLSEEKLAGIQHALLISTKGTTNKSVISLEKTIEKRGLRVVPIASLREFIDFEKSHKNEKVLLVRSPIPNQAEDPILVYIEHGWLRAQFQAFKQQLWVKVLAVRCLRLYWALRYRLDPKGSYKEAEDNGLLKNEYKTIKDTV